MSSSPPPTSPKESALRVTAERLVSARQSLLEEPCSRQRPLLSPADLSALTRAWLEALLLELFEPDTWRQCVFYELGSLARDELCLHSDIDLLIEVHDEDLLTGQPLLESITALMDAARSLRLKLKHVVRTPDQHAGEFERDWRTPTALLDARPLPRDAQQKREFIARSQVKERARMHLRGEDEGRGFVEQLIAAHLVRRSRHNQSLYLLEPDLKHGLGALRDLNALHWASLVRFDVSILELDPRTPGWGNSQHEALKEIRSWLMMLRMHLHSLHRRAQERLRFTEQESLAHCIYAEHSRPIEQLMRSHYQMTRGCLKLFERTLRAWGNPTIEGELTQARALECFGAPHALVLSAPQCMRLLSLASQEALLLEPELETMMSNSCSTWPSDVLHDTRAQQMFLELLTDLHTSPLTSTRLLDLGILTKFLPEFIPLVCHVQHDTYHVHTTDVHTLKCLERTRAILIEPDRDEACQRWPAFVAIAQQVEDPPLLLLAALLHDIGKNRGGDHSNKGADLVPAISRRWGLSPERATRLERLVRHHLLLSNTSRRLDISDARVLDNLMQTVDSLEFLSSLTTLTFCDMSTVSATAMNDWRAHLLARLHYNLEQALRHRRQESHALTSTRSHGPQHKPWTREQLRSALLHYNADRTAQQGGEGALDAFLDDLPEDALTNLTIDIIQALHLTHDAFQADDTRTSISLAPLRSMHEAAVELGAMGQAAAQVEVGREDAATWQLIVCTRERAGTLAQIAGVLSANGLNILSAQLISTQSGLVLDMFHIEKIRQSPHPNAPAPELTTARQEKLCQELREVLDEGRDVRELLRHRLAQHRAPTHGAPEAEVKIIGHQDLSDDYTVLELHGPDRPGLLHDIARALHEQHIEIRFSKLDLLGNQAIDTFYVESMLEQGKLSDPQLEAIEEVLRGVLEQGHGKTRPTPHNDKEISS